MPPPTSLTLTLVVAATTRNLGIGCSGTLPWPSLKGEMGYFARVTKRAESGKNAVVMGRKTWGSIPPKFRPLKGRVNVVVSGGLKAGKDGDEEGGDEIIMVGSLEEGLRILAERSNVSHKHEQEEAAEHQGSRIDRIFIIGGATIYKAALDLPPTLTLSNPLDTIPLHIKVLLTRIHTDFECDTFFPLDPAKVEGWTQRSRADLETYVGEDLGDERIVKEQTKDGTEVEYEFSLWDKH